MAKIKFKEVRFREASRAMIDECNKIIVSYMAQGLRLTLRQLYYQLVTRNLITNEEKSYRNLGSIVSDGRLAGLIDWNAIEDRVRRPRSPTEFEDVRDLVDAALRSYRLPRWDGQDYYAELWVEKDALAGVLEPLAYEFHVTLMVNRGYSSQSAMFDAARRFMVESNQAESDYYDPDGDERKRVLFYLGDHDPSGEDMVRDIDDRLRMFGVTDLDVRKIALTMDQVRRYNPPPNPAKLTDSRAAKYVQEFGRFSWEVDALPPEVLSRIVRSSFEEIIDRDQMDAIIEREESDRERLTKAAASIK